jgi:hypothetical protein
MSINENYPYSIVEPDSKLFPPPPPLSNAESQNETVMPKKTERCELEGFTQCSESHLWKLMMSFYDRKGPESWSQGIVPHFITCNTYIGRSYAKVNKIL